MYVCWKRPIEAGRNSANLQGCRPKRVMTTLFFKTRFQPLSSLKLQPRLNNLLSNTIINENRLKISKISPLIFHRGPLEFRLGTGLWKTKILYSIHLRFQSFHQNSSHVVKSRDGCGQLRRGRYLPTGGVAREGKGLTSAQTAIFLLLVQLP